MAYTGLLFVGKPMVQYWSTGNKVMKFQMTHDDPKA